MFKNFIKYIIDDEIHHPIITRSYRVFIISSVVYIVLHVILNTKYPLNGLCENILAITTFIMFIDFLLRIIGAVYGYNVALSYTHKNSYQSLKGYIFSFYGIVDFLSAITFIFVLNDKSDDVFIILSLITLLKLARFTPALGILIDVLQNESKPLLASLYVMSILSISTSTIMYFIERESNQGFDSLVDALWWSIITLATVGYGDVVPQSELGKLFGGLSAISGFGMFALPAGILANGFANEIKRVKEIASLEMITKVPLFSSLDERAMYDISTILRLKRYRKNEIIIKEGTQGDAMYFIVKGSVSVIKNNFVKTLKNGDFFGEIALIENVLRTATIKANTKCELLELSRYDFNNLINTKPELLKQIEKIAKKRYKNENDTNNRM